MRAFKFYDATAVAAVMFGASVADAKPLPRANSQCVGTKGVAFELDGKPFNFAGTNVYDTAFVDTQHISDVMTAMKNDGYKVLRTWAFNEVDLSKESAPSVYFQSWQDGKPTINTGDNGLGLLDQVIEQAETAGIKLILTLANNWSDYGGMDVYVNQTLGNNSAHDLFYTNTQIMQYWKDYVSTIVFKHKDSPAIFSWELANEARCTSYTWNNSTANCSCDTITTWADTMSSWIKTIDPDHMVSIGIEGYFNRPATSTAYEYDGSQGQDYDALIKLEGIDFGCIHIYIPQQGEDEAWSLQYLKDHDTSSQAANKPAVFEEYGVPRTGTLNRTEVYGEWRDYIFNSKAINGDMSWMSIQLDDCTGSNEYAICPNDTDYTNLVTDWTVKMNGKQ